MVLYFGISMLKIFKLTTHTDINSIFKALVCTFIFRRALHSKHLNWNKSAQKIPHI